MAIQTKIDGGKQAITFYKDTEPCAVYVDGEFQQDLSFVPSELVQGTGSVEYTSVYKKNQIEYELTGATEQGKYVGRIATTESLTPYSSYEEDIAATHPYYSRILRSTQPVIFPATDDESVNVSLINVESIASQIPIYETLFLIDENMDEIYNLFAGGNAINPTVPTNISYYLGIVDEEDVGNDNERCYNLFVQNGSLQFEYNGESTTPTPQTPCPIENANSEGMTVTVHGENLIPMGYSSYKNGLTHKHVGITYTVQEDGGIHCQGKKTSGYSFFVFSNYSKLRRYSAGTYYFSLQGNEIPSKVKLELRMLRNGTSIQSGLGHNYTKTLKENETFERFSIVVETDEEIDCVVYPMVNYGSAKLPYKKGYFNEISIPTSVEVEGTTVPLLFSEWDKLTVDRLANKVTYTEGSWQRAMTGVSPEQWILGSYALNNGYGNYYVLQMSRFGIYPVYMKSYSNMFRTVYSQHPQPDNSLTDSENLLIFVTDRETSLADWKAWLQQKYAEGDPVVVLIQRKTPINHDITNTDLGQSLLNLATQNQTNYFEVQGNAEAPPVPIKLTYAKWGGNIENNNNT